MKCLNYYCEHRFYLDEAKQVRSYKAKDHLERNEYVSACPICGNQDIEEIVEVET